MVDTFHQITAQQIASARAFDPQDYALRPQTKENYSFSGPVPGWARDISEHILQTAGDSKLRGRQPEMLSSIGRAIQRGVRSMVIEAPPGYGKTSTTALVAGAAHVPTLHVVGSQDAIDAAEKEYKLLAPHLKVGQFFSHRKDPPRDVDVLITPYASFRSAGGDGRIPLEHFKIAVLDDGQRGLGHLTNVQVNRFVSGELSQNSIVISQTATPYFNAQRNLRTQIGPTVFRITALEAIEEGQLRGIHWIVNDIGVSLANVPLHHDGYDDHQLQIATNIAEVNNSALQLYLQALHGKKVLIFTSGRTQSLKIAELFADHGVGSAAIISDVKVDDRRELFKAFNSRENENGRLDVLTNCRLLSQAIHLKGIDAIFDLTPSFSAPLAAQKLFRGSAYDPERPGSHVEYYSWLYRDSPRVQD